MPVAPEIVKSIPLFSRLAEPDLRELAETLRFTSIRRGDFIVKQGDEADALYVIITGRAKAVMIHESGREVTVWNLVPKDFLGEMGLFDDQPRSASVQALEPCQVLRVQKNQFLDLLKKNPGMAMEIIGGLVTRLRGANRKIESLALFDVYGRVARLLLEMSETVGGKRVIPRSLPRTEIASMVGASREMVSRVMSEFEKQGHIRTDINRIVLLDRSLAEK